MLQSALSLSYGMDDGETVVKSHAKRLYRLLANPVPKKRAPGDSLPKAQRLERTVDHSLQSSVEELYHYPIQSHDKRNGNFTFTYA